MDIYLLCPVCETITEGDDSGDQVDSVMCKKCSNHFVCTPWINYKKYDFDIHCKLMYQGKRLLLPVELEIDYNK